MGSPKTEDQILRWGQELPNFDFEGLERRIMEKWPKTQILYVAECLVCKKRSPVPMGARMCPDCEQERQRNAPKP